VDSFVTIALSIKLLDEIERLPVPFLVISAVWLKMAEILLA
jgi:hypothetical protein